VHEARLQAGIKQLPSRRKRDRPHAAFEQLQATARINVRANKPGLLRRILHAIFESRQAQADREIAAFLLDQADGSQMRSSASLYQPSP